MNDNQIQGAMALVNTSLLGQDPPDLLEKARAIAKRVQERGFRTSFGGKDDPELVKLLKEACLMAARIQNELPAHWLTISGSNGCGKTMLAARLAKQFEARIASGFYPRYWTCAELKRAYLGGAFGLIEALSKEPWLVIDELGAEKGNDAFREAMIQMFNERLGRWTVITTNLSEAEIEAAYTSRLTSRMVRGRNVHVRVQTEDYASRPK